MHALSELLKVVWGRAIRTVLLLQKKHRITRVDTTWHIILFRFHISIKNAEDKIIIVSGFDS